MDGVPFKYREKYRLLKRRAEQLHQLIESGEYFRMSWLQRHKLVRRVNRLYRQIAGPIAPAKLQYLLAAAGILSLSGCEYFTALANDPPTVEIDQGDVTVKNGQEAVFTAIAEDADGDTLTFQWFVDGEEQEDSDAEELVIARSPQAATDYEIRVEVSDGIEVAEDDATLTVNRPANNPAFGTVTQNPFGLSDADVSPINGISLADVDGDGDLDLFYSGIDPDGSDEIVLVQRTNTGTPENPSFTGRIENPFGWTSYSTNGSSYSYFFAPVFGDLDTDGDLDAVAFYYQDDGYGYNEVGFAFVQNNGGDTPQFGTPSLGGKGLPTAIGYYSVQYTHTALADIDNDGDLDFFYGSVDFANDRFDIYFVENTGTPQNASFALGVSNPFGILPAEITYIYGIDFIDIDGDGDKDLILGGAGYYAEGLYFQENSGTPENPSFNSYETGKFGFVSSAPSYYGFVAYTAFGDLDSDGDYDAFVGYDYPYFSYSGYGDINSHSWVEGGGDTFGAFGRQDLVQSMSSTASTFFFQENTDF